MMLAALAGALWVWPSSRWSLHRVIAMPSARSGVRHRLWPRAARDDHFATAATIDLFAVCLRAGLPTPTALVIAAASAPSPLAERLSRTAELLELGADAEQAWGPSVGTVSGESGLAAETFERMSALSRRSARAGSVVSDGLVELAEQTRRRAHDAATAAAERAGVAISGPLGLSFLPAFVCLGIVPVVVGLAGGILG